MTSPLHSKQTLADGIHATIAFEYADSGARLAAASFVAEDKYKMAFQASDETIWMLTSVSPITWVQMTIAAAAVGGGDPNPAYLVLSATGSLTTERVFSVSGSSGLIATDAGAGSTLGLAINNNIVATISGSRFTGPVTGTLGINLASSSIETVKTFGFDQEYNNGNCGGSMFIDWSRGQKQVMTMTASVTMSFFASGSQKIGNYLLRIVQGFSGGPYTILWPSGSIKWPGGTKPTLSTGSLDIDIVSFYNNGGSFFGMASLDFV